MKLKGHTSIELVDATTGEKKTFEDDNMITNGLNVITNGMIGHEPYCLFNGNTDKSKIIKALTGGLMLFDNTIEENASIVRSPAGVNVVGCGAGITYSGAAKMAGSYNDTESGEVEKGYKHVWDFNTSQGNGHIACASLTTQAGGKLTEGIYPYSSDYAINPVSSVAVSSAIGDCDFSSVQTMFKAKNYADASASGNPCDSRQILYANAKDNYFIQMASLYQFAYSYVTTDSNGAIVTTNNKVGKNIIGSKKITLDVVNFPFTKFSISATPASADRTNDIIKTIDVDMPSELSNIIDTTAAKFKNSDVYFNIDYSCDEEYLYLSLVMPTAAKQSTQVIDINDTIYVWKIKIADFTSELINVTNTTGEKLVFDVYYSSNYNKLGLSSMYTANGYTFVRGLSNKLYYIKHSDNTVVKSLKYPDGSFVTTGNQLPYCSAHFENDKLYFRLGTVGKNFCVYDTVSNITSFRNIGVSLGSMFTIGMSYLGFMVKAYGVDNAYLIPYNNANSRFDYFQIYYDPTVLVTINNLEKAVDKTASQTMKVTYTLTMED